jgi:hypothetical protein
MPPTVQISEQKEKTIVTPDLPLHSTIPTSARLMSSHVPHPFPTDEKGWGALSLARQGYFTSTFTRIQGWMQH